MKNWIKDRSKERTSMDGILMIALGVAVLCLAGPILTIAAYAAIVYGGLTVWKKDE